VGARGYDGRGVLSRSGGSVGNCPQTKRKQAGIEKSQEGGRKPLWQVALKVLIATADAAELVPAVKYRDVFLAAVITSPGIADGLLPLVPSRGHAFPPLDKVPEAEPCEEVLRRPIEDMPVVCLPVRRGRRVVGIVIHQMPP
jgi:hypothetical protein